MKKKTGKIVLIIFAAIMFLTGLYIYLWPKINNYLYEVKANEIVESFYQEYWPTEASEERLERSEETRPAASEHKSEPEQKERIYPELYAAMQAYNEEIYENKQAGLADPWCYTAQVINLSDYGIEEETIGVLSIPKMEFEAPIFLGATYAHLDDGVAHLSISSMPIGGINTNCVIAGHRGWYGAEHLHHIDLLEYGDVITVTTFWDVLRYKVVETKVIEPYQPEELLIQDGREMLTIVTCHPYGSGGKQRYVVYCERIHTEKEGENNDDRAAQSS